MTQLLIAATLLLTTTFSMNVNAQKVSDEDLKGTEQVYKAMMSAFGRLDAAGIAGYYPENGTHISPNGQIVTGRAALTEYFKKLFAWFMTLPRPDKMDNNQTNWNTRYLSNDLIMVNYNDEHTNHFGNKVEKETFAMSVILKRTKDGWLCEEVTMTPVKPIQ